MRTFIARLVCTLALLILVPANAAFAYDNPTPSPPPPPAPSPTVPPGTNPPPTSTETSFEQSTVVTSTDGSEEDGAKQPTPAETEDTQTGPTPVVAYGDTCEIRTVGRCYGQVPCWVDGVETVLQDKYVNGVLVEQVCEIDSAPGPPVITPGLVREASMKLSWPSSKLGHQPRDGHFLINRNAAFFTTNSKPSSQDVRLLGVHVLIEVNPASYTWYPGDGTSQTTTDPGAPYPNETITHVYLHPGQTRARVDTTYTGRYRVNNGPWITIPGTLTVRGPEVAIEVHEARPTLVS